MNTQIHPRPLFRPALYLLALIGATLGFTLMASMVFSVDNPPAEWGEYWRVRPLVVIALAGAAGGAFMHLMIHITANAGILKKLLAYFAGAIVYVIALWMGTVAGCHGTLWN